MKCGNFLVHTHETSFFVPHLKCNIMGIYTKFSHFVLQWYRSRCSSRKTSHTNFPVHPTFVGYVIIRLVGVRKSTLIKRSFVNAAMAIVPRIRRRKFWQTIVPGIYNACTFPDLVYRGATRSYQDKIKSILCDC